MWPLLETLLTAFLQSGVPASDMLISNYS